LEYKYLVPEWDLPPRAQAFVFIAHNPAVCPRDTATTLGITERSVLGIVTGLTAAGYVVNDKEAAGRGHRAHGNATGQSDQQHECEVALPSVAKGGGAPVSRTTHDPWQAGLEGQQDRARNPTALARRPGRGPVVIRRSTISAVLICGQGISPPGSRAGSGCLSGCLAGQPSAPGR